MQVYVRNKVDAELLIRSKDKKYDRITIELPQGMYVDIMSHYYLPEHIKDEIDEYTLKSLKSGELLIVYLKSKYWVFRSSEVDVPKSFSNIK